MFFCKSDFHRTRAFDANRASIILAMFATMFICMSTSPLQAGGGGTINKMVLLVYKFDESQGHSQGDAANKSKNT